MRCDDLTSLDSVLDLLYDVPMSKITRCERITASKMEPYMDGHFEQRTFEGNAWRCDDCGLVWDRKHLAEHCSERKHVPSFRQTYHGHGFMLNGVFQGQKYTYERHALRREQAVSA